MEKAERALIQEKNLKADLESKQIQNTKLLEKIGVVNNQLEEQDILDVREKTVAKKELKLENSILEIKLAEAEKRADSVTHLVETVFKNRKLVIDKTFNVPLALDGGGGCGVVTTASGSSSEISEEL